ncbi:hypothetical protein DD563_12535 [Pelagicola sp. LXJ1103]|nr:hypothetical protein DD563_12535 [Pelagicola sp. LXJ1103]
MVIIPFETYLAIERGLSTIRMGAAPGAYSHAERRRRTKVRASVAPARMKAESIRARMGGA